MAFFKLRFARGIATANDLDDGQRWPKNTQAASFASNSSTYCLSPVAGEKLSMCA
jgi:hypothetical protein